MKPTWFNLRRLAAVLLAASLAVALYWSLRLTYADWLARQERMESVNRAIRLARGNAQYYVRAAELLKRAGAGEQLQEAALEQALALNPRDSEVWMELGLLAEMRGEWRRAERCLLEAARVDRTSQPRRTLANYYFRRGEKDKFWQWVREALEKEPAAGDMAPLFRLCWSLTADAGFILERALPERVEVLRQYLGFLLATSRLDAAEAVAARLLPRATREDLPLLLACCDRWLETRRVPAATDLWNALVRRGLLPYEALNPAKGAVLTNGSFTIPPRGQGFDWRIPRVEGITASLDQRPSGLRFTFSGKQPEQCELLWQYLPLAPAADYRFRFEYQTEDIPAASGLRWELRDVTQGRGPVRLAESGSLSSADWRSQEMEFTTPAHFTLARLVLVYRRALGTTRISGWIALRNLELTSVAARSAAIARRFLLLARALQAEPAVPEAALQTVGGGGASITDPLCGACLTARGQPAYWKYYECYNRNGCF